MMKSLSCVLLLFVCNVIHSNNCCLKNEESDVVNFVKRKLLGGCKEVKNSIDSSIKNANDIIKDDLKVTKIDILNFTFKVVDDEYIKNSFSLGAKSDDKESKKSKNEKKLEEVISSFHSDYFLNTDDNSNFLIYVLMEDMFCNYGGYIIKVPILFLCKFEVSDPVEDVYDDDDKIKEISGKFFGDIFANKVVNKCYFFGKTNIIDVNMGYLDEGGGKTRELSGNYLLNKTNSEQSEDLIEGTLNDGLNFGQFDTGQVVEDVNDKLFSNEISKGGNMFNNFLRPDNFRVVENKM